MTWTITGTGTHTPLLILDFQSGRSSLNSADTTLDNEFEAQLRDAHPAGGNFRALFAELSAAIACRDDIGTGHTLTVTDDEDSDLDMEFFLADGGRAEITADIPTGAWALSVDFQEVPA